MTTFTSIATVAATQSFGTRLRLLTLRVPPKALTFVAGQGVSAGVEGHETTAYSIACSPECAAETQCLELLLARNDRLEAHRELFAAGAGTPVLLQGPFGGFGAVDRWPGTLVCVAGGCGIAPIYAMVDHCLRVMGPRKIVVVHSARTAAEFCLLDRLERHETGDRLAIQLIETRRGNGAPWPGRRFTAELLRAVVGNPLESLVVACGPVGMVDHVRRALQQIGLPPERLWTEQWSRAARKLEVSGVPA